MKLFDHSTLYSGLNDINFNLNKDDKIVDIGGGNKPYKNATHVIDFAGEEGKVQRHGADLNIGNRIFLEGDAAEVLEQFDDNYFEFFTTQSHYGHVNLCRLIGDTLHISSREQNSVIPGFAAFYEALHAQMPAFNYLWEIKYRFIWEARHYWEDEIKYKYYENAEDLYPQLKYFKELT